MDDLQARVDTFDGKQDGRSSSAPGRTTYSPSGVGRSGFCSPRHPTHFESSSLDLNDTL